MAARIVHYKTDEGYTAEFYLHKKIGEGCFGEVYVTYLTDCHPKLAQILPKVLACKRIRLRSRGEIEEMKEREIKLSNSVKTNNAIKLY